MKRNHKNLRQITSSSELLAKYFYKIIETGDLRYLLKLNDYDNLPIYDQELLLDAYDSVIVEHEKDSCTNNFTNNLISVNYGLKEKNKLESMNACYLMLFMNPKKAISALREFGINIKDNSPESLKTLENKIKSQETKLRLKAIKDRNRKEFANPYYDIVYILENELKSFDENTLTLKKMDALLKNINIKNKKSQNNYGG